MFQLAARDKAGRANDSLPRCVHVSMEIEQVNLNER